MIHNQALIQRFLRYVAIDTQSCEETGRQPSTEEQRNLARVLAAELRELGAEVDYDEAFCYVYAVIPGEEPALGLVAHMDTSPAASGKDVQPRILYNYDGQDSLLKPEDFPELASHLGEDLITTDGTTLLGADDKAGIAEIMNLAEYYLTHPKERHRTICIAFTPDEEVGAGTDHFDLERFPAKEAYTCDGGGLGGLEYECFNAAGLQVDIQGRSVHPGDAKNKMLNACQVATEFHTMLPAWEVPEHTEGYEGFYHLDSMEGTVEHATLKYILRDHDREKFEHRKEVVQQIAAYLNQKYQETLVHLSIKNQYRNMAEVVKDHYNLVDRAVEAMERLSIKPVITPIRGGTDGAALTYMGVPCPNLGTGGYNFHGRFEYASIQEMERSAELLKELVRI